MKIYNICDSLTISVVKHVQLQKLSGAGTVTSYRKSGIMQYASDRCGVIIQPANIATVESFVHWADVVVIHTSINSMNLLNINTHGRPVIWACHDWVGMQGVDPKKIKAVLVPSIGYQTAMKDTCLPVHVIHRKVAKADWPKWSDNRIDCTVMCGAASDNKEEPWRDYTDARDMLKGNFIVMSSRFPSKMTQSYMVMETCDPGKMIQNMARFETSWCGCGNDRITFDTIVNNKYFDSIAAGCVPILYRSKEMSEHGKKYGCALEWNNLPLTQTMIEKARNHIRCNRAFHYLESELPEFNMVLDSVMALSK